jgi:bifunctional UDP-N-acetylglucosamine pyrophosphorylase/glucosamine-1-phosphate N-acetyltransferase
VGSGSVITNNVPPGALALGRGRQVNKPKWKPAAAKPAPKTKPAAAKAKKKAKTKR